MKAAEKSVEETERADACIVENNAAAEESKDEPKRISGWSEYSTAMAEIMAFVDSITDATPGQRETYKAIIRGEHIRRGGAE